MTYFDTSTIVKELVALRVPQKKAELFVKRIFVDDFERRIKRELAIVTDKHKEREGLSAAKMEHLSLRLYDMQYLDEKLGSINANLKWIGILGVTIFCSITFMIIKDLFF